MHSKHENTIDRPISLFIPGLNGGGAQKVVVNLANALLELTDHPVHVVLARKEGAFLDELRPSVHVVDLGTRRASRSVWALTRYMRRERPKAVVSSLNYANVICVMAGLLAGKPCPVIVREDNVVRRPSGSLKSRFRGKIQIQLMKIFYPRADKVVAISDAVLQTLEAAGIKVNEIAVVIGNPITTAPTDTGALSLQYLPVPRPPFLCSVGRLTEQKGFDTLITAFAKLKDTRLQLVILGEGELRDALHRQVGELRIKDRVYMPGFVKNPMAVVRKAEAFVMSSRWEGFGNVLVEALSTGVPVVSTDCPGAPRDILENGAHGHLVPYDDPEALAVGISMALDQPAGTPEGRKARANDFSAEKIARKYLECIL